MSRRSRVLAAFLLALMIAGAALLPTAGTALVVEVPIDEPEAILVLASHEWERLPEAASLARRFPNALVFLTVPQAPTIHNCHDCEGRVQRLIYAGVDEQRVVQLPQRVSNTRDEARAARAECTARGLRRLAIVTSPYHTRRAWKTFRDVFAGTDISLGIFPSGSSPANPRRWLFAAYDRAYVRYEWAAIAYRSIWP